MGLRDDAMVNAPRPFRGARHRAEAVRSSLADGGAGSVPCKLRRTSARGWGAWTDAELLFAEHPDVEVRWRAEDPIAVGFPITRGPVDMAFGEVTEVYLRSVRFQTEAFFGRDAEIVVVASDRGTIELAVRTEEAPIVAERLEGMLAGDP